MNRRDAIKRMAGASALGAVSFNTLAAGTAVAEQPTHTPKPLERDGLSFWLESSLRRVYPLSPAGDAKLELLSARNEKLSFQACFKNTRTNSVRVRCEVLDAGGVQVRVRRVGFVTMRGLNTDVPKGDIEGIGFIPGLCPDPLFPEQTTHIGPDCNGVFWISLYVPKDAKTGVRELKVRLTFEDEFKYVSWLGSPSWSIELPVRLDVRPLVIEKRKDFPATHWISADSIWEYYRIEPYSERFWQLTEAMIANAVEHGLDVIYTPIFNSRHELLVRPAQLLRVKRTGLDSYAFDFTDVRRWVRLALKHGANHVEWTHFFTPAPTSGKHPQRIYERGDALGELLWPHDISATSDTYRKFLEQFLPAFKSFLEDEKILDRSFFHCADEPDGDEQMADYRKARALLKELAPWIKVIDAMSDTRFATERLSDMPIPSIVTAPEFTKANCPAWTYFCCGPRQAYLQRLLDTPLSKIRMAGWLFYKLGAKGFLHWGHNYWFTFCTAQIHNPFDDASVGAWPGLPYGDPFVVYPGADGPLDSIRWEVFAESLQDYALLQSAGIKPDDAMLASLKDYQDFPKGTDWIAKARRQALLKG